MAITAAELGVTDEELARRILVRARIIAPCIDSFADWSEEKLNAIAILKGVIAELPEPGALRAKSMSRNGTSIELADIKSAFEGDAEASLRSLCSSAGGMPRGRFPDADRAIKRLWPERYP